MTEITEDDNHPTITKGILEFFIPDSIDEDYHKEREHIIQQILQALELKKRIEDISFTDLFTYLEGNMGSQKKDKLVIQLKELQQLLGDRK